MVPPVASWGVAWLIASQIELLILAAVTVVQPMVGAGHLALSQQSSGSRMSTASNRPALAGASGQRKKRSAR